MARARNICILECEWLKVKVNKMKQKLIMIREVKRVVCTDQLLEGRVLVVQVALHGEVAECFPWGRVALHLHRVDLQPRWTLVTHWGGRDHGHAVQRPL